MVYGGSIFGTCESLWICDTSSIMAFEKSDCFMPLTLFNLLTFKRLDWISILAISIWQLHHWEAAPIYIVAGLVIMMVLFGSHESREYFNDSAAKLVIKMMKDKYGDE